MRSGGMRTYFVEWNQGIYQWINKGQNYRNLFLKMVNCFSNIVCLRCGCEFILRGLDAFILNSTSQSLCCYAASGKYLNSVQITSSGGDIAVVCNCPPIKQFTCCWMPLCTHIHTYTHNNNVHIHAQIRLLFLQHTHDHI